MSEENLNKLRKLVGEHDRLIYEAVKQGAISHLTGESQCLAKAIQDHLHLRHVCNAFEFADVREGQPYEIQHQGSTISPLAHVTTHAAVKDVVEQNEWGRSAFAKLLSEGASKHHAEHVLCAIFLETYWDVAHGGDPEGFQRALEKISASRKIRRRWIRTLSDAHPGMD